jgi:predicted DNA-binding protein YlxM (UPF0122 family)
MAISLEDRIKRILEITEAHEHRSHGQFDHINPELVRGLLESGVSMQNIGKIYGCIGITVTAYMKKEHPDFDAREYFIPHRQDITTEELARLYKNLGTCPKVAKKVGMIRQSVSRRLKRAGVKINWPNRFDVHTSQVIAIYSIFKNTQKVAEFFGMNRGAIRWRLKRAGISTKKDRDYTRKFKGKPIPENEVLRDYPRLGIHTIALRYHVPDWRVRDILVDNEVRIPKYRTREDIPDGEVVRLYIDENWSMEKIIKKYDSSYQFIKKVLDRNQIQTRKSEEQMHERKYTPKELTDAFKSCKNPLALSKKFRTPISQIIHDLKEAGQDVFFSTIPRKYHKTIVSAYESGQDIVPIARGFGMQAAAIRRVLVHEDVPLRTYFSSKHHKIEKLNSYFREEARRGRALNDTEIGEAIGLARALIRDYRHIIVQPIPNQIERNQIYQQNPGRVFQIPLTYKEK